MTGMNKNVDQPLLSISIMTSVRKDKIRRCLDSLAPIREQVASELVMVDTGCDEEMLGILREYTDKIVKFPWCDDFAAARNAGIKEAKGKWLLVFDDDQWFVDTAELVEFFNSGEYRYYDMGRLVARNLLDPAGKSYADSSSLCMMKLEPCTAYVGKIHEQPSPIKGKTKYLHSVFLHDGYAYLTPEERYQHTQRNVRLLDRELKEEPNNIHNRYQLVMEYCVINEWRKVHELCKESLELLEDIRGDYFSGERGGFYAGCVEANLHSMRLEEAIAEGRKALADPRNPPIARAKILANLARAHYKEGDEKSCRSCCLNYFPYYDKWSGYDELKTVFMTGNAFDDAVRDELCCFLTVISLKEGDIETAKRCFHRMGWERGESVTVYDDGYFAQWIRTMADTEYDPWYAHAVQLFTKSGVFVNNIMKLVQDIEKSATEDKDGNKNRDGAKDSAKPEPEAKAEPIARAEIEDSAKGEAENEGIRRNEDGTDSEEAMLRFERVARIFSQSGADHFYIDYLKIRHAGFVHGAEGMEETYERLFSKVIGLFHLDSSIWQIAEESHLDLDRLFRKIPFQRWVKDVVTFCSDTTPEKLEKCAALIDRVQSGQDIRYEYFRVRAAEARLALAKEEEDYERLHGLMDDFSSRTLALHVKYYKKEAFRGEMGMLPDSCRAAVWINKALEAEKMGDYRTALQMLKESIGICDSINDAVKKYSRLSGQRFKEMLAREDVACADAPAQGQAADGCGEMPEDTAQKSEMEMLADGVKAKAREFVSAGLYEEARQTLEQLLSYLPGDQEARDMLAAYAS